MKQLNELIMLIILDKRSIFTIAHDMGVCYSYLRKIIHHESIPSVSRVEQMLDFFGKEVIIKDKEE